MFFTRIGLKIKVKMIRPVDGKREFNGILESYDDGNITIRMPDESGFTFTKKEASWIKVDDFEIGDIISSELFVNNNFLLDYFEPDSIEYEATEYKGKKYNLPTNYYINMYFGNYPLLWELISDPHLQAGFSDMRVLISELEE
jgi:hypothetical protein